MDGSSKLTSLENVIQVQYMKLPYYLHFITWLDAINSGRRSKMSTNICSCTAVLKSFRVYNSNKITLLSCHFDSYIYINSRGIVVCFTNESVIDYVECKRKIMVLIFLIKDWIVSNKIIFQSCNALFEYLKIMSTDYVTFLGRNFQIIFLKFLKIYVITIIPQRNTIKTF